MTDLEELGQRGAAFYDAHLKAILEPAHDREFVAIHPDTGDYAVARWSGDAVRALRARHPEGSMWIRKIGSGTGVRAGGASTGGRNAGGQNAMMLGHVRDSLPRVMLSLPGLRGPLLVELSWTPDLKANLPCPCPCWHS